MYNSKFKLATLAAFALLVAAPVAGADPARVVSEQAQTASAQRIWPDYTAETAPVASSESALPALWPDAGVAYSTESVSQYGAPDPWAANAMRGSSAARPDAATIAGMRMNAAAEHYGVSVEAASDLRSPDAVDAAASAPDAATIAGLRMNAAADHYGAPLAAQRDLRSPDTSDAAAGRLRPPSVSDLRSPDTLDAADPRVTPTTAPVAVPASGDQPSLAPADSDFPWAGLLVGLGLAGMAGLLALVAVRGTRARPLGR